MACASQSLISANIHSFPSHRILLHKKPRWLKGNTRIFSVNASASSSSEEDCNVEECAPEKEVGKVSMEWLAGEKTRVAGTFPPKKRGWTGYVEKDTAGQTNIYSIEPAVYVAESAISSGTAGTSSDGAENTAAIAAGLALISLAAASSVLLQVGKNAPPVQTVEYSGPPLSYYVSKFKPASVIEAPVLPEPQSSPPVEASVPAEASDPSAMEAAAPSDDQITSSASGPSAVEAAAPSDAQITSSASGPSAVEAAAPSDAQITSSAPSEINPNAVPEAQVGLNEPDAASYSVSNVS